jgi:hypothetical protein
MNPSSYLYIGPERWNSSSRTFEVPSNTSCSGYDDWSYGLTTIEKNQYRPELNRTIIESYFPGRKLTYTVGTKDISDDDGGCEATLMGDGRYERGKLAYDFMKSRFPQTTHTKIEVEGVAHDANAMINSPEVLNYLTEIFN